ncbi:SusD/RagB family nutrient-binding outer membrane lipoprotein [Pedobacter punctiformis]|uniref:SusD/RagB family nutrient-binding outer membrane lipoprotein n=1 Tax=Pedobacter punctiformis TaxID=3004097 RepID=A0ABT4LD38_9SPHI|nr:SusD/RagB family nutrient-binding outer membrane lipoprotein [Pedobacter sp. HCMS5-2]MCZ4245829.1 SusD/RagB family nutrient-binding outer membrane lipoprotein [Pedobacter sp. HCMS5-2]
MIKKTYTIALSLIVLTLGACKKDLLDTNKNPNESETAQSDYLLANAIKSAADNYYSTANTMDASLLFIQYWAKIQYPDQDRYIFTNGSFESGWKSFYTQSLADLNVLIKQGQQQNNPNYTAVGLTLRSWIFSVLTDAYGSIPYKEALDISKITPKYDDQRTVYIGLIADLKTALTTYNPSGNAIGGDPVFGGNINSWRKFANALRFRLALRIADREPDLAKQTITEVLADPAGLISTESESVQFVYASSPNQNPIAKIFETRDDYRVSKTLVDKLIGLNDPRLAFYANKTATATPEIYAGLPNGVTKTSSSRFDLTSKPGNFFTKASAPAVILSYSESLFDRAEAASRGFSTENAAALYQQAITTSFQYYGIDGASIQAYLAQPAVQYNASNFRKSIGEQKWIALFGQGLEAFAEWRRLDYPQLQPAVEGVLDGKIPSRFIYPGGEQSVNKASYTEAVAKQGPDLLTTKLWFDVN